MVFLKWRLQQGSASHKLTICSITLSWRLIDRHSCSNLIIILLIGGKSPSHSDWRWAEIGENTLPPKEKSLLTAALDGIPVFRERYWLHLLLVLWRHRRHKLTQVFRRWQLFNRQCASIVIFQQLKIEIILLQQANDEDEGLLWRCCKPCANWSMWGTCHVPIQASNTAATVLAL